ncbi:MAG: DSD1 family PLP-dependent enzyme [Aquincola sp.]|nr:DSD1 family PLP-dependent enzyme [Aquincola sp.]MDH4288862.1 DSD1 family PLP-dependent enzyme [Aquincola sp.]MDH5328523.1 DSD1 family PLP-dependent enzyme [Aquincola sp.]
MNTGRDRTIAQPGDPVDAIDTPALVVDLDAMDRNLAAMAAFSLERGVRLRPHAKTHKSAWIARRQIEGGAVGVCVQKTSEAEALAALGVADLYISNEVVDAAKLARVAALAARVRLAIAVDSVEGVDRLAAAMRASRAPIDVFVEIDVGHGRCGAAPRDAAALARRIRDAGLRFAGLQAYQGRAQHLRGVQERRAAIEVAAEAVRAARAALDAVRIDCALVTGAGSGSFVLEAASGLWGELQCGSYVFMDRDYADNEAMPDAPRFEHALFVKSQVMSRHADRAVIDAGHKSHAIDSGLPRIWRRDDLVFANGGDEHGIVRAQEGQARLPTLGEALWLVPGHCDPTVNLHDTMVGVRGGLDRGVVERLIAVDARGALG